MTLLEYAEDIAAILREEAKEVAGTEVVETQKNGRTMTGLKLTLRDEPVISPTVYMDEMYEAGANVREAANRLLAELPYIIEQGKAYVKSLPKFDSFEDVRELVIPALTSTENDKYLLDKAYKPLEDIAVTYVIPVGGSGNIRITEQMLEKWRMNVDELHEAALANLDKHLHVETLAELFGGLTAFFGDRENYDNAYFISNSNGHFGAAQILNTRAMDEIAAKNGLTELVIVPTSIHECILLQNKDVEKIAGFCEGSRKMTAPEDRLSDSAYVYNVQTKQITKLTEEKERTDPSGSVIEFGEIDMELG